MRIYVAGSMHTPGIEYVQEIQAAVRACGHEITYDWTTQVIGEMDESTAERLAEAERDGVLNADLLILIDHERPRGALIEMGMALGTDKEALVLLKYGEHPSLFYHLPNCTVITSHDNLLRAIELLPDEPYCHNCDGKGYFERLCAEEEDSECIWCDGTGIDPR